MQACLRVALSTRKARFTVFGGELRSALGASTNSMPVQALVSPPSGTGFAGDTTTPDENHCLETDSLASLYDLSPLRLTLNSDVMSRVGPWSAGCYGTEALLTGVVGLCESCLLKGVRPVLSCLMSSPAL